MRQQFVATVSEVMKNDEKVVLILGDIGVHGFRNTFAEHPTRTYNIGILEQATVSMASGLAMNNLIPIVHTIAPFLVERSFEQLKDDFGYQKLNGNFVSVGASYDYASLGCTHHCPADIGILKNIPSMSITIPGTPKEFDTIFKEAYADPNPTYYRLSEDKNNEDQDVHFGKANIIKKGNDAVIIAVGPILQNVIEATEGMDVTILYYTSIRPFDSETLKANYIPNKKVIICEPYYMGALTWDVTEALKPHAVQIEHIGVPHEFLREYGTRQEHHKHLGLDTEGIKNKIKNFLN